MSSHRRTSPSPASTVPRTFQHVYDDDQQASDNQQNYAEREAAVEEDRSAEPPHAIHGDSGLVGPHVRSDDWGDIGNEKVGDTPCSKDRTEVYERRLWIEGLLNGSELGENNDHDFVNERDCDSFTEPGDDASGGSGIRFLTGLSVCHIRQRMRSRNPCR